MVILGETMLSGLENKSGKRPSAGKQMQRIVETLLREDLITRIDNVEAYIDKNRVKVTINGYHLPEQDIFRIDVRLASE